MNDEFQREVRAAEIAVYLIELLEAQAYIGT